MSIAPLPVSAASSGIQSVQDLYNLINGQTTTQSSTTSQAGMNAMLKSALESSQGLAAVSSGQRAAGGYGSSVNTLLTNDLMARAAGSIAASNQTKTTTVGGVNKAGSINVASMLGLAKSGLDLKTAWDKYSSNPATSAQVSGANFVGPPTEAQSAIDSSSFMSGMDANAGIGTDSLAQGFSAIDTAPSVVADAGTSIVDAASNAADPGLLDTIGGWFGFADGGAVTANDLLKKRLLASGQRDSIANDAMDSGGFGSGAGGGGTGTSEGSMGIDGIGNVASSGAVASAASLGNINNIATRTITNALLNIAVPGLGSLNSVSGMMGGPSVSVSSLGTPSVTVGPISVANTQEADMTQAAMNDTQDAMNEANNSTTATSTSVGDVGTSGTSGTSVGDGGGAGDAGSVGGNGDADGGSIEGPGTSVSDSIPAKLSDGEFVFSADVVKAIGLDKLQAIQDKFHTPAATQRLMAFGKGVR